MGVIFVNASLIEELEETSVTCDVDGCSAGVMESSSGVKESTGTRDHV
jgi:hypothetical protein